MDDDTKIRDGFAQVGPLRLCYQDIGNLDAPPILLIMGFASQLTRWPDTFCERLVAAGHRVIRFDNRDVGLSDKLTGKRVPSVLPMMVKYELGLPSPLPYTLVDMAADAIGVLDALGIGAAHVVGCSMGGMIAQIVAARYPERVRSLGIIFSSTNQAFLPPPKPRVLRGMVAGPGPGAGREQIIDNLTRSAARLAGPAYPPVLADIRARVTADYDRAYHPAGVVRQLAAVLGTGSLRGRFTRAITAPTVVLHGTGDPLMRYVGGKAIARAIPDSTLHLIKGWGHDFPAELFTERVPALLLANMAETPVRQVR